MILQGKIAVIYGAGGSLGQAVSVAMAREGATVYLTGRSIDSLTRTAEIIRNSGGKFETALVDAFSEEEIEKHLQGVIRKEGRVDISFNLAGVDVIQNKPLIEFAEAEIVEPVTRTVQTRFLTAKSAGIQMKKQGHGVILFLTATPGGIGYPNTGGFALACAATESLSRNLAIELGAYGVRVLTIRSGGSPDSAVFRQAIEQMPEIVAPILEQMKADTMLKRLPVMEDIAQTAVFLASDAANAITGTTIDVTAGTTGGLNYRVSKP